MEILDIVDENGLPTGQTVERTLAHAQGIRHRTAHVWLLRRRNGKVQVLLQKRSENKDSFPGCYDISSAGHIPAGVDFAESALRELREELGVTLEPSALMLCGNRLSRKDDVFHGQPFHDDQYSRVFAAWYDAEEADFALQKEEVSAVRWMDLAECMEKVATHAMPHCIRPEELTMIKNAMTAQDREERK